MAEDAPKIIVDDDWKSQAQAEKAKLAEEDAKAKAQGPESGPGGVPDKLTFDDLVKMMATQALMYLGAFPDPQTGKAMIALDMAKLHIDMLGVIQDKTKGNLSDEERSMLDGTTHELRLQFSEIVKALEKAQAEGKLDPQTGAVDLGGGPPPAP